MNLHGVCPFNPHPILLSTMAFGHAPVGGLMAEGLQFFRPGRGRPTAYAAARHTSPDRSIASITRNR